MITIEHLRKQPIQREKSSFFSLFDRTTEWISYGLHEFEEIVAMQMHIMWYNRNANDTQ